MRVCRHVTSSRRGRRLWASLSLLSCASGLLVKSRLASYSSWFWRPNNSCHRVVASPLQRHPGHHRSGRWSGGGTLGATVSSRDGGSMDSFNESDRESETSSISFPERLGRDNEPSAATTSRLERNARSSSSSSSSLGPSRPVEAAAPRRILLVDDELAIREAVGQLLREHGFDVTTCANGKEAWRLLTGTNNLDDTPYNNPPPGLLPQSPNAMTTTRTSTSAVVAAAGTMPGRAARQPQLSPSRSNPNDSLRSAAPTNTMPHVPLLLLPHVIVSDVHMPDMNGLSLLEAIRATPSLRHVPVVLLTVRARLDDRVAGYTAGADAYIPKPFDEYELLTIIDNVVARHEALYSGVGGGAAASGGNGAMPSTGSSLDGSDSSTITTRALQELQRDVQDIQRLVQSGGGGGAGFAGWVAATNVFLAPDERQILQFLCDGLATKEIAARTFLSPRRVEQLLTSMFRKTQCKNRTELVRWAIATGTVKL
jgi:DNA-binding NarL/FixJ family response regulator